MSRSRGFFLIGLLVHLAIVAALLFASNVKVFLYVHTWLLAMIVAVDLGLTLLEVSHVSDNVEISKRFKMLEIDYMTTWQQVSVGAAQPAV